MANLKFKVGDKVRRTKKYQSAIYGKLEGVITRTDNSRVPYLVQFGGDPEKTWWCEEITLELVEAKHDHILDANLYMPLSLTLNKPIKTETVLQNCIVYIVYKCNGDSWPQDGRIYGVRNTLEKAKKLRSKIEKRHPNDHIAILTFMVE